MGAKDHEAPAGAHQPPKWGHLDLHASDHWRWVECSRFYRCVQTPPLAGAGSESAQQQQQQNRSQLAVSSLTRLQYECPSGLVFDEQFQICNWPSWSAQCSGSGEVNSITNSKFVCPNYGYFQNQENCEYFYYCSDYNRGTTQAYQFRCPFELGFDEERLQCNWKWLVKGCSNSTSDPADAAASGPNLERAQKYLAALESNPTSKPAPADREEASTSAPATSTAVSSTDASTSAQAAIGRRSLELEDGDFSGRGFTASLGSHVSSLLASVAAVREHRMKKANQAGQLQAAAGAPNKNKLATSDKSDDKPAAKPAKYPSYIGLPLLAGASSSDPLSVASNVGSSLATGFRLRRRQQQQQPTNAGSNSASNSAADSDKQSVSASTPYRRRPPPPSLFSFLPNSAIYMLADSLRSVGEAASDEVNRYMRIAGDRMRELLGHRGPGGKLKHKQRRSDDDEKLALESALASLASKLSSGGAIKRLSVHNDGLANQANYHALVAESQAADQRRTKRVRRDTAALAIDELEDLQALESGSAGQHVYVAAAPSHHAPLAYQLKPPVPQQQQQQHYADPLGRPPGYPLNPLDSAAKQAVLGPEPKMFTQPSHLVINQLSGISQADYERLIRPQQQQQQQYQSHQLGPQMPASYVNAAQHESNYDPMVSAASEPVASQTQFIDHSKVIDRILGQAREAFTLGGQAAAAGQQEPAVPFGMPAMVRPVGEKHEQTSASQETKTTLAARKPQQKRRSTVAMKLATLALPKFSLLPTTTSSTSAPPTTTGQPAGAEHEKTAAASNKYMSFLPSFIVNKAMGFNRAVHDLISTLAPGSSSKSQQQQQQQAASTPQMPQILSNEHQARLQQHFQQQQQQQMQMQTTPLPSASQSFQKGQNQMMHQQQQQQLQQTHPVNVFNRTSGPLLLTESEARALSAQLDQLSKEQLEALSADLFKNEQSSMRAQIGQDYQQQVQQAKQEAAGSAPPPPQQQSATESPDYVVRLLRMISQTSHNPEDVRLLEQLTSQLNNPRPNGQDQSLIEIGQPDDLALLEALGMIPSQAMQQQQPQQDTGHDGSATPQAQVDAQQPQQQQANGASDNRPEASYNNYQMSPNDMRPGPRHFPPGAMKPFLESQKQRHQQPREPQQHMNQGPRNRIRLLEGLPALEIDNDHLGTTKFIPVALDVQHELTTPTPLHQQPAHYSKPQHDYHTTTTTTAPRPTQVVTQEFVEQSFERPVPPVKQTYTEMIEKNVTTPDGIETTVETRTKSAISGGAAFGISSQVGLGMIPAAFAGSVPTDSPMGEQQARELLSQQQQQQQTKSNESTSSDGSTAAKASTSSSSSGSAKLEETSAAKDKTTSEKPIVSAAPTQAGTKGYVSGDRAGVQQQVGTSGGGGQQIGAFNVNERDFQAGLSGEQREAIFNSQQLARQQLGANNQRALQEQQQSPDGGQGFTSGQFGGQFTQFEPSGGRTLTNAQRSQILLQGAQQPLINGQTQSRFASAQAPGGFQTTLGSYNFMQPVDQTEEVVIKKKFKPFAKTMIVPQMTSYSVEELQGDSQPLQQQLQQQSVSAMDFNTGSVSESGSIGSNTGNAFVSSGGGGATISQSISNASQSNAGAQMEQIKEDEFSTVASTFGENAAATSASGSSQTEDNSAGSMTRTELQQQRQLNTDLKMIERQLQQQEANGQPAETLDPNAQLERESSASSAGDESTTSGRTQRHSSADEAAVSPKPARKSNKKSRKSQKQGGSQTSSTTAAPRGESETEENTTAKRSVEDEEGAKSNKSSTTTKKPRAGASASRVEEAFSNFMVELQRSRKPTDAKEPSSTTSTTSTTTTTSRPTIGGSKPDGLESSSSEQRNQRRRSRSKKSRHGQRTSTSTSERPGNRKQSNKSRRNNRAKSAANQAGRLQQAASEPREREVAIYGTKSGFMPIISANDPSYATQPEVDPDRQLLNNQLGFEARDQPSDPLSFGASFTSSKRQSLGEQALSGPSAARKSPKSSSGQQNRRKSADASDTWQNYFGRKLSDQISVVHLGNYSERTGNHSSRLIQVKLVILPASPNNQLLNPRNWQHLASSYPALFPRSLDELRVETIDLGEGSIRLQNGGLIDEHIERARHASFRAKYERVSELIEPRTFKALDEIVQRSSGQLFMVQRRDSLDRTIIALIPDRPFIRSALSSDGATGGYQRLVLAPAHQKISSTTAAAPPAARETTTQRAATFSRAIQESIHEAIRQHYDSVKSQLRQSMAGAEQLDSSDSNRQRGSIVAEDEEYNRRRHWSTPSAEALARIESSGSPQAVPATERPLPDPMEAASSSTEFSLVVAPPASARQQPPVAKEASYGAQAIYEVEGAEPKTLYGLELDSNERHHFEQERARPKPEVKVGPAAEGPIKATLAAAQPAKSRFISIGPHLMASPMKKIVDQAYVNHFYDHISDHQLARSIGFDEPLEQQPAAQNSTAAAAGGQPEPASEPAASKPEVESTARPAEESLVPESACTRAGLFQHPFACNKFYECFWDKQLNKYTLHMFECPIKLAFDERIVGCAMPIESSLCVNM